MKRYFLFLICLITFKLNALEHLNCLILLEHNDSENIAISGRFYLMSKLQSALAEQASPILIHAAIWNGFIERRISFEQTSQIPNTIEHKISALYKKIKERTHHWTNFYNTESDDITQNKSLVAQRISEEFYTAKDALLVSDAEYQLLLNYITPFDPQDWSIYKKDGFYLLLPKKYIAQHSTTGFKLENLEEVTNSQDSASTYFESKNPKSFVNALSDFFIRYQDVPDQIMDYTWNIVLSGHGGSSYKETNNNKIVTWDGQPCIANLNPQEFKDVLEFFHTDVKTHLFQYSGCSGGGNHIDVVFENGSNRTYNFPIIVENLTDCTSYCKWNNPLRSNEKKFLTTDDLYYNSANKSWNLITKSPYEWNKFFNAISKADFSQDQIIETIARLPKILSYITYPVIASISLLRRPGINNFYPLSLSDTIKIDDRFIEQTKKNLLQELETSKDDSIVIRGARVLLLESTYVDSAIQIENDKKIRLISIKPGEAVHYIKKLTSLQHIDLTRTFCQAEYQAYNKTLLLDECVFPHSNNSPIFKDIASAGKDITLKNVVIIQQSNWASWFIRLFFTINDKAIMVVTNKKDERDEQTVLKEIICLTPEAKQKYEEYYLKLKTSLTNQSKLERIK